MMFVFINIWNLELSFPKYLVCNRSIPLYWKVLYFRRCERICINWRMGRCNSGWDLSELFRYVIENIYRVSIVIPIWIDWMVDAGGGVFASLSILFQCLDWLNGWYCWRSVCFIIFNESWTTSIGLLSYIKGTIG